jgi:hypothetical protein
MKEEGDTITQAEADILNAVRAGRPNMTDYELADIRLRAAEHGAQCDNSLDVTEQLLAFALTGRWR